MSGTVSPLSWPWPDQLGGGHVKYKRTLGDVILPDWVNLTQELVKQGWCWWYRRYAPWDTVLEGLEQDARVNVTIPFSRPLAHPIVSLKGR